MQSKQSLVKYIKWLQDFNPILYTAVKVSRPDIFSALKSSGLGAADPFVGPPEPAEAEPWYASILNTIADTAKAFVPIYQQKKILETQLDLAKSGQPMLTNDQIRQAGTTNIQVDLPSEIKDEVIQTTKAARSGINWGTLALLGGGVFLIMQMGKKGRRR